MPRGRDDYVKHWTSKYSVIEDETNVCALKERTNDIFYEFYFRKADSNGES